MPINGLVSQYGFDVKCKQIMGADMTNKILESLKKTLWFFAAVFIAAPMIFYTPVVSAQAINSKSNFNDYPDGHLNNHGHRYYADHLKSFFLFA